MSAPVDEVLGPHKVSLSIESRETDADATVRRVKDLALFFASMLGIGVLLWLCVSIAASCESHEEKRWATSIVTAVVGGLLGYLLRK